MSDLTVTDRFVYALAGCKNREEIAQLCAIAAGGEVEWAVVLPIIEHRFSKSALLWINDRAATIRELSMAAS